MYSGEYDACDVTLSVYPHQASLQNMPDHSGNRTYDLWNTSPMLCQLSYAVWSVRVCDYFISFTWQAILKTTLLTKLFYCKRLY